MTQVIVAGLCESLNKQSLLSRVIDKIKSYYEQHNYNTKKVLFKNYIKSAELVGDFVASTEDFHLTVKCLILIDSFCSDTSTDNIKIKKVFYPEESSYLVNHDPQFSVHGLSVISMLDVLKTLKHLPPYVIIYAMHDSLQVEKSARQLFDKICADITIKCGLSL